MRPKATLYTRTGAKYRRVEFAKGRPSIAKEYSGQFYLRYSDDGKRLWRGFETLDLAIIARDNLTLNFDRKREGLPQILPARADLTPSYTPGTIADATVAFLKEQEPRVQGWRNGSEGGLSPATLDVIKNALETFLKACSAIGAFQISELKDPVRGRQIMLHVVDWMQQNTKRRKGKAAHTDGKKFVYIAQLLAVHRIKMAQDKTVRWDGDPGLLRWHEVPRAKKSKVADVVFYTPADLKAMWDGAGKVVPAKNGTQYRSWSAEDIRDVMAVLTLTGMRDEEVQHLQWDDILWANGAGLPKFKVKDKPQYDWKPKNGERIVQPVEYFAMALRDRLNARMTRQKIKTTAALIFPTTSNTPDQNFADQIRKAIDNALKAGHHFNRLEAHQHNIVHNFRRTFATVLNSCYGLSAPTVQDRIGDADLTTVQRYLGKVDDPAAMRKAFERIPFGPKKKA
jgi:integrase